MELTYTLAILVNKKVVTKAEASKLLKATQQSVINSNLTEMGQKVERALSEQISEVEKIDAKAFLES